MKQTLERSEQNFVTKLNHAPHIAWGLYYMSMSNGLPQAQSQGGAIGQSLEGGLLLNIRKLFTKQPLERNEKILLQNKIMPHTLLGVCTACPCPIGYPQPVPGGTIVQSQNGSVLLNIRKLFTKQALEMSEQDFVTKFNHAPHLSWGLYYKSMSNGLHQAQSQGAL